MERQQTSTLIFFFPFWQNFQGAGGCKCKYFSIGKKRKKEKSVLKRSGRSVSNNTNSFMGMHCLPAFAKSSFIEGCLPICRRMPGILGMAHIYINTVTCACLSVCLSGHGCSHGLHSPLSLLCCIPSASHQDPKTTQETVAAAVLTLQNDFSCHPIITVRSHFPSKPKKQGRKMYFPTEVPMGCWEVPCFGRAELAASGWFCRCRRTCR